MTCLEAFEKEHPEIFKDGIERVMALECPHFWKYAPHPEECYGNCAECWDREVGTLTIKVEDKPINLPEGNSVNQDVVSHPAHYCYSNYEPRKVIRDWGLNFNLGNVVKYVARAGRKDDILQELKKARQYLDFEIEEIENERGL